MKKLVTIVVIAFILSACSSKRNSVTDSRVHDYELYEPKVEHKKHHNTDVAKRLEKEAREWLGTKYKYGGESRKGTDCSGMVMVVFETVTGIKLPRDSHSQQQYCKQIDKKDLAPGDLVFFITSNNGERVNHVGLYIGNGDFIHSSTSKGVIISNLNQDYYKRHFHSAGRVPGIF